MSEQKSERPGYIRRICSQCEEGLGFTESDPCDKCSVSKPSVAEARELLPCPFCGASAGDIKLSRGHGFIIGCTSCQAQQFAMERTEAARLWNTRVDPASYITQKAQRAAERIWNNLDRTWTVQEMVEIIAAEFTK